MKKLTGLFLSILLLIPSLSFAQTTLSVSAKTQLIASLQAQVQQLLSKIGQIEDYLNQEAAIRSELSADTAIANAICAGTTINPQQTCQQAITGVKTETGLDTILYISIGQSLAQIYSGN